MVSCTELKYVLEFLANCTPSEVNGFFEGLFRYMSLSYFPLFMTGGLFSHKKLDSK